MKKISRRSFLKAAAAMGASLAWVGPVHASRVKWHERRELYPQGVASGDPDPHSVILWTRRPFAEGTRHLLTVEVAEDETFERVIAHAQAPVSSVADWTTRVLIGGLKPAHTYWYRFTDTDGNGSRVGRTITAPSPDDPRPVNFAFVSCQDVNEGKLNAYRRMIYEDERAPAAEQLGFVLHLGDFIYEVVEYPDEVKTRYDRTIYEVARIPDGGKVGNFHFPLTVDGYRAIYKGYLADPDLQDARARWPFVAIWDNHEFSWQGWQSIQQAGGKSRPGQSIKVAANQAWFEYLPVALPEGQWSVPRALRSARGERCCHREVGRARPGRRAEQPGRDQQPDRLPRLSLRPAPRPHHHRSAQLSQRRLLQRSVDREVRGPEFTGMFPEDAAQILDGGRAFNGGNPPAEVTFNDAHVPNPQRNAPPQTILGAEQKAWFKDQLRNSTATWKIWGNSEGALDSRADPQNLPRRPNEGSVAEEHLRRDAQRRLRHRLPGARRDLRSRARREDHRLRHRLGRPPQLLGRICDVGTSARQVRSRRLELRRRVALQRRRHGSPRAQSSKNDPLRAAVSRRPARAAKPDWTFNMLLKHGVRSCLEYAKSFDLKRARSLSNPDLAPHLEFVDLGGHGYAKVRLSADEMRTEFVCIPRPITRSEKPDGGPIRYRVVHTAALWKSGERPQLKTSVLEGNTGLSV